MWMIFAVVCIVILAVLFIPGYLFARAFGASRTWALCGGAIVSPGLYALLSTALTALGISCSFVNVFTPVFILAIICFTVSYLLSLKRRGQHSAVSPRKTLAFYGGSWSPLVYATVGIGLGIYLFLMPLESPSFFVQEYDNTSHLNVLQAFSETGKWSVFTFSKYLTETDMAINPFSTASESFYPAAWHIIGALVASIYPTSTVVVENALIFSFAFIIYPLSMLLLLDYIFKGETKSLIMGSVASCSFIVFPLGMIIFGPLFPNLSAYAIFPAVLVCALTTIDKLFTGESLAGTLALFFFGALSLTLLQTNAIFLGIILFFIYLAFKAFSHNKENRFLLYRFVSFVLVALIGIAIWTALFYTPFLQGVLRENWVSYLTVPIAVKGIIGTALTEFHSQLILSVFITLGFINAVQKPYLRWIAVSLLLFYFMYVVDVATEGFLKHYLTGFWYTDSHRIAANIAIVAVPLVTAGLTTVADFLQKHLSIMQQKSYLLAAVVALLFALINYYPTIELNQGTVIPTPYGQARYSASYSIEEDQSVYSKEEIEFVNKVVETIPHGSPVLNVPEDGSVWSYGINDLHTYYRYLRTFSGRSYDANKTSEKEESWYLRSTIDSIETNTTTQKIVENLNCKYVLLLDMGSSLEEKNHLFTYETPLWEHFQNINDTTPGFEIVLADGDMRLYRIKL